jgi:hypothetical protein
MSIYAPYFYIIEEVLTGKKYAGSRIAKGVSPSELLQPNGYLTSSKYVYDKLQQDINSFRIVCIEIYASGEEAYNRETQFLVENNCASSIEWLNGHNNDLLGFGTEKYFHTMEKIYGKQNPMQVPSLSAKQKDTIIAKYGVDNPSKAEPVKEKKKSTFNKRFGVDYPLQDPTIYNNLKRTNMERYGVENVSSSTIVKEKKKTTFMERYGGSTNPSQIPEVIEERKREKKNLASRRIVTEIKTKNGNGRNRKIPLGRGWYFKSYEELLLILQQLDH